MTRKRFISPADIPAGDICRNLIVPASQDWLGVFSEALSQTIYAYNYEQVNDTDLTPEAAAAEAYTRYEAWLDATCEGGTCPPAEVNGKRVTRHNPTTGKWEQIDDESFGWEPPDEGYAVPAQVGRSEPTDDEKICAAVANATECLRLLYEQSLADFFNEYSSSQAFDAFGEAAGDLIFAGITALIQAYAPWVAPFWELFWGGIALISTNVWTLVFQQHLRCILLEHASIAGGVVTFDFQAVNRDLVMQNLSSLEEGLWVVQVEYMLLIIGADGLNLAGELDLVAEPDCTCAPWTITWLHGEMHEGEEFYRLQGTVNASGNIVPVGTWPGTFAAVNANTVWPVGMTITSLGMLGFSPSPNTCHRIIGSGTTTWVHSGLPEQYPNPQYAYTTGQSISNIWADFPISISGDGAAHNLTFNLRSAAGNNAYLEGIRVSGTGPCPFETGTRT